MQRKFIRKCLEQILFSLNSNQIDFQNLKVKNLLASNPGIYKKVIVSQGIGPYLFHLLQNRITDDQPFADFKSWLECLYDMNTLRIQKFHADLENILIGANRAGIPIMPLKGSLLTTHFNLPAGIRPMADIDMLIKPNDFSGLKSILETAGYQLISSESTYANNYRFIKSNNAEVIDMETEHPDNPRPVEVHTELSRPLFGNHGAINLTEFMWEDSFPIEIFNQKAISPTLEAFFSYLAVHASGHLFTSSGRLLHLLDLAFIANKIHQNMPTNFPDRVYLPLKLASRAFPSIFVDTDFSLLEYQADRGLRKWAAHIPLDDRCGLTLNLRSPHKSRMQLRILRWKPVPWRVKMAYSRKPLPIAYILYFSSLLGRAKRLLK